MIINLSHKKKENKPKEHCSYLHIDIDEINKESKISVPLDISVPFIEKQYEKDTNFIYFLCKENLTNESLSREPVLFFIIEIKKCCNCYVERTTQIYNFSKLCKMSTLQEIEIDLFIEEALLTIYESGFCKKCRLVDCCCKIYYIFDDKERDLFEKCPVCLEIIDSDRYYCCKNSHRIHYHCFSVTKLKNKCPICKTSFDTEVYCKECIENRIDYD